MIRGKKVSIEKVAIDLEKQTAENLSVFCHAVSNKVEETADLMKKVANELIRKESAKSREMLLTRVRLIELIVKWHFDKLPDPFRICETFYSMGKFAPSRNFYLELESLGDEVALSLDFLLDYYPGSDLPLPPLPREIRSILAEIKPRVSKKVWKYLAKH